MYINKHFSFDDNEAIYSLMQQHPFAMLVAENSHKIYITHIPLILHRHEGSQGALWGHIPLEDPIALCINNASSVLAVFYGARSYISPQWYKESGLPTYNFTVVHIEGQFNPIANEEKLYEHLIELTRIHETHMPDPWHIESTDKAYIKSLLKRIVGFSITINSIAGKCKLSQNRSHTERQQIIQGLQQLNTAESTVMAGLMKEHSYLHNHFQPLLEPP